MTCGGASLALSKGSMRCVGVECRVLDRLCKCEEVICDA